MGTCVGSWLGGDVLRSSRPVVRVEGCEGSTVGCCSCWVVVAAVVLEVGVASLVSVGFPLPMKGRAVLNQELLPIPPVFVGCSGVESDTSLVACGSEVAVPTLLSGVSMDLPVAGVADAVLGVIPPETELRALVVERS